MISFSVNELFRTKGEAPEIVIHRILWIDSAAGKLYTININSETALPVIQDINLLVEQFESGLYEKTVEDPYLIVLLDESLTEVQRKIMDNAWTMIEGAVRNEPGVYFSKHRGKMIREIMKTYKVTKMTLYKYLRKYWQRGKLKIALLPDYINSGGRGKPKTPGHKKLGRPRLYGKDKGVNTSEEDKKYIRIALSRYYFTPKKNTLKFAYDMMLRDFYTTTNRVVDGNIITEPTSFEDKPTLRQFNYLFYKEHDLKKTLISRENRNKFELKHRAILGKSETGFIGPGSVYQIDSTIGDIYLISDINKNDIIGRPVIYIVVDVFTKMITGLYVGLEGPSWAGSMMALYNAVSDKKVFCAEYGIDIQNEDWPCKNLPETLIGDRGEIESKYIETLINTLNVRVDNTPPYRGDLKGIVERFFKTINTNIKPFVPGFIDIDFRERGAKDYRLEAKLTLHEFTEILIWCVLYHNNHNRMENYSRDEMMISDNIEPVPLKIWNWGITNRSGALHTVNENILKLNLLPAATATVTEKGIKFRNGYYSCEQTLQEYWFERARSKGSWKVDISYEERTSNYIYIRDNNGKNYITCFLLEGRGFRDKSILEIERQIQLEKEEKYKNSGKSSQAITDLYTKIEGITNRKRDDFSDSKSSKASRIKWIRENRAIEKQMNRKKEAFDLSGKPRGPKLIDTARENIEEDLSGSIIDFEYIKKKQKERQEKNNGKRE